MRDLEWVIASPPIIQGWQQQQNWTESSFWRAESKNFHTQYQQLDTSPDTLNELLQQQHDHRLGHRFETLLSFWFETNQRYQIIAQNLQINDGNKTLGEFDFIVKDQLTNSTQHWEVACKFYLGIGNTQYRKNWVGPMLKDRLSLKYKAMKNRQSLLSEQPVAQQKLKQLNIHIDQRICLMKGRLFYPLQQAHTPPPTISNNNHQRGWWARPGDFQQHFKSKKMQWRPLKKNQWLALQRNEYSNVNHTTDEILHFFLTERQQHPLCIVGFANNDESHEELVRVFLVAKDWAKSSQIIDNRI